MIDWPGVAANAAWILGCALALATLSYTSWLADRSRSPWRAALDRPSARGALALAGLLFCLGLAGSAILGESALEAALWLALALVFLAQSLSAWRRSLRAGGAEPGSPPATRTLTLQGLRRTAARLADLELWVVLPAVGLTMVSARWLPWAAAAPIPFWGLRWLGTGRLTRRTPADLPVLLLALTLPVTLWATSLPELTFPQVFRLLAGLGLFYALVNGVTSQKRLRLAAAGVCLAALFLAAFSLVSVEWSSSKFPFIPQAIYERFPPLVADTANPNVMAGSLVLLTPLAAALALFGGRSRPAWLGALGPVAALAAGAMLALTQARAGLLALAAALLALAALRWRRGWLLLLPAAAGMGALAAGLGPERLLDLLSADQAIGGLAGRAEIWSRALYMIEDFPFTGIGMGSFTRVTDLLYPLFRQPPGRIAHAHNLFLQVAVDLGLPGLIAWLGVLLAVTASAWQFYRRGRLPGGALAAGLGAGLLCSQVALASHGLVEAVTWGLVRPAPLVWGLWGLAAAGHLNVVDEEGEHP